MQKRPGNKFAMSIAGSMILLVAGAAVFWGYNAEKSKSHQSTTFVMDTLVTQTAYGPNAQAAMREVNIALADFEKRLTLFSKESDVARINLAAGRESVEVAPETAALIQQSVQLSQQSDNAFAITIAPLTMAWGVTTDSPRVVPPEEIQSLLELVDDSAVKIEGNRVGLERTGMALDLGGIAKGASCSLIQEIYFKNKVESGIVSIGGNIYVRGNKPDGSDFRVGFRNPYEGEMSYIASFSMPDKVMAVSGGYERFFEENGQRYIHIIDPRTGMPAVSDILSVGVVDQDGAVADFYSTTLFVWGKEKTLDFMRNGGSVIMLDQENTLYVSKSLEESFSMHDSAKDKYTLIFI